MDVNNLSYAEKTTIRDTIEKLQKELHYTNSQMWNKFPDLYKALRDEELENIIRHNRRVFNEIRYGIL